MIRLAIIAALALSQPALAQSLTGIAHVGDGDSFTLGDQRIRLFGIDSPEYRQTCTVGFSNWACGSDAAAALRTLIDNRLITCIPRDRDVYGRTVAKCLIDGRDVAAEMVKQGSAVVLDNGQGDYAAIEARAKAAKTGIWSSTFQMPSEYRKSHPRGSDDGQVAVAIRRTTTRAQPPRSNRPMYYTCAQARAAGAAPMRRGQASYNPNLDGDGDGISCEPYRGRR